MKNYYEVIQNIRKMNYPFVGLESQHLEIFEHNSKAIRKTENRHEV